MLLENLRLVKYFFLGIILQIIFFESWDFLGYIDPVFYIIFFLIYKFDGAKIKFIILCFSLGLIMDLITQNPGANTIASLIIGYIRPFLINFCFGVNADISNGMISGTRIEHRILLTILIVFTHHLVYFVVSYFSADSIIFIVKNTILTGILTFIVISITLGFISKK
jgi:hypothetical protein